MFDMIIATFDLKLVAQFYQLVWRVFQKEKIYKKLNFLKFF